MVQVTEVSIGYGHGLALNRQQAITRYNYNGAFQGN